MSSAAEVAAAREETRKKLHEKIESYEKGELGQEYHRTYPFKIPTAIRGGTDKSSMFYSKFLCYGQL